MAKAKKLKSGNWRCLVYDYTDENGKRHYESFTAETKKEAEYLAAEFALNKKRKREKESILTFGEALDEYISLREAVLSPGTVREYKRSRRCDLQGIMKIKVSDLTQEIIQKEINKESQTHSPKTVRNMHGLISAVLGVYRPDFALNTDLPKKVRQKIYVPSNEEIQKIITYAKNDVMEIPILLAAFGPLRRGEIAALDSSHVNGNIVHVEFSMALNDRNEWVIKRPKSYSGDRYIEFPEFVIDKLKGINGKITPLNPAQISDRFSDVLKRAEVPHFRFHDLRHYCASIQHAIGIPDVYIMQRGGWGNDGVLKSVYRHTMEEKVQEMNQKANNYFSNLCNTKCNTKIKNPCKIKGFEMQLTGLEPVMQIIHFFVINATFLYI